VGRYTIDRWWSSPRIAPVGTSENPTLSAPTPSAPLRPKAKDLSSPALSQDKPGDTIRGRKIAILGGEGVDAKQLEAVKDALMAQEALVELIAAHAGMITDSAGKPQKVNRAAPNAPSVIYDAVVVLGGSSAAALAKSGLAIHFLNEAYRHGKPIAAIGDGSLLLDASSLGEAKAQDGVIVGEGANAIDGLIAALLQHRFPNEGHARLHPVHQRRNTGRQAGARPRHSTDGSRADTSALASQA
jgi:catalase